MLNTETIYQEASNWLRLANTACWQIGAIFIPLSIGGYVLAIKQPDDEIWLFIGSMFLWLFWVYLYLLYGRSAKPCRAALEDIEKTNKLPGAQAFYSEQGILYAGKWGSKYIIYTGSLALLGAWLGLFIFR